MIEFWQAAAGLAVLVGLVVGVVIGMAIRTRTVRGCEERARRKLGAAEYGLQLLAVTTGKSRTQLWHEYQYRSLPVNEDTAA